MTRTKADSLLAALRGKGKVLILTHDNPDPDAMASAAAVRYLIEEKGEPTATVAYGGIVGRSENRALLRTLRPEVRSVDHLELSDYGAVCLVDTQPGSGNNALPETVLPSAVVDHHPLQERTSSCPFYDVRPKIGAVATMATQYLRQAGLDPPARLATALLYAIKSETQDFSRGSTKSDEEAFAFLFPLRDGDTLAAIENPRLPKNLFLEYGKALHRAKLYGEVLISDLGVVDHPDIVAEIADFFRRMDGVRWTVCMGCYEGRLYLSIRTMDPQGRAGDLAQAIVGLKGTAGGHGTMAGGRIPLIPESGDTPYSLQKEVVGRILLALEEDPSKGEPLIP